MVFIISLIVFIVICAAVYQNKQNKRGKRIEELLSYTFFSKNSYPNKEHSFANTNCKREAPFYSPVASQPPASGSYKDSTSEYTDIPANVLREIRAAKIIHAIAGRDAALPHPRYFLEQYGRNYKQDIESYLSSGLIRFATEIEALEYLTIPELKDILRAHGLKLGGKKSVLIQRIKDNLDTITLPQINIKRYIVSPEAQMLIERYDLYIAAEYLNYTVAELYYAEQRLKNEGSHFSTNDTLFLIEANHSISHIKNKDWSSLAESFHLLSFYQRAAGDVKSSLRNLIKYYYLCISGLANHNQVEIYDLLALPASIRQDSDSLIQQSVISSDELHNIFVKSVSEVDAFIPFSYFNVDVAFKIYQDFLKKPEIKLENYKQLARIPSEHALTYEYYPNLFDLS